MVTELTPRGALDRARAEYDRARMAYERARVAWMHTVKWTAESRHRSAELDRAGGALECAARDYRLEFAAVRDGALA